MKDRLFARIERLFDVEAFENLWVLIAGVDRAVAKWRCSWPCLE